MKYIVVAGCRDFADSLGERYAYLSDTHKTRIIRTLSTIYLQFSPFGCIVILLYGSRR